MTLYKALPAKGFTCPKNITLVMKPWCMVVPREDVTNLQIIVSYLLRPLLPSQRIISYWMRLNSLVWQIKIISKLKIVFYGQNSQVE